jgi:hypothetical protein
MSRLRRLDPFATSAGGADDDDSVWLITLYIYIYIVLSAAYLAQIKKVNFEAFLIIFYFSCKN